MSEERSVYLKEYKNVRIVRLNKILFVFQTIINSIISLLRYPCDKTLIIIRENFPPAFSRKASHLMFTFWMILSGDCVHVRSTMKRENCGFCPKSLRFNESCRLKVVGLKLLHLTSSNFSSMAKQLCQMIACVGFDCAFRKSNMNDTL